MFERHPETALIPYSRGELSGDEQASVEAHLRGCDRCRELVESSSAVLSAVGQLMTEVREPDWSTYRLELRRKLAARDEPREVWWHPRFAWGWMSFATLGAAAIALLLVVSIRKPHVPGGPPMDQIAMESELKGADIGLLRNYKVVEHLDLLENYDVIENLPSTPQQGNEKSS